MSYERRIVCLANSRKPGGRCIAGLEFQDGEIGGWIRPVRTPEGGAVPTRDRIHQGGHEVKVLDVIDIVFKAPHPVGCQTENHLYDRNQRWRFVGRFDANRLAGAEFQRGPLWVNGSSSYCGLNDRVLSAEADHETSSLLLVRPTDLRVRVVPGFAGGLQARGDFVFDGFHYNFVVTDPQVEEKFLKEGEGMYRYPNEALLCVSVGEELEGFRYKLIAAIVDL